MLDLYTILCVYLGMEKRNKTVDSIKINVNDYRVDSGYSYRLVGNPNLDLLVNEIQGISDEDKTSELEANNDSSIYGIDNIWGSLDEEFVPPAGFTESSSFDPEDECNF